MAARERNGRARAARPSSLPRNAPSRRAGSRQPMMPRAGLPGPSAVLSGDHASSSAVSARGSPRHCSPAQPARLWARHTPQERARRPPARCREQLGQGRVLCLERRRLVARRSADQRLPQDQGARSPRHAPATSASTWLRARATFALEQSSSNSRTPGDCTARTCRRAHRAAAAPCSAQSAAARHGRRPWSSSAPSPWHARTAPRPRIHRRRGGLALQCL